MTNEETPGGGAINKNPREKELDRVCKEAGLKTKQVMLVQWMVKETIKKSGFITSSREIYLRICCKKKGEAVNRELAPGWRNQKFGRGEFDPARTLVNQVRFRLNEFNATPSPYGVSIDLPDLKSYGRKGNYRIEFRSEAERLRRSSPKVKAAQLLRSSVLLWERLISPIMPELGVLIYSNEQPERGKHADTKGVYAGAGEVAASLLIGARTAHLNCEITPVRSKQAGPEHITLKRSWLVFLGSPASNRALELARGLAPWKTLQKFTFEPPANAKANDHWVIHKNSDPEFKPRMYSAIRGHEEEYALISYFRNEENQQALVALSGMSTASTWAAAQFVCEDESVDKLMTALRIDDPEAPMPSFEALLKVAVYDGAPVGTTEIDDLEVH